MSDYHKMLDTFTAKDDWIKIEDDRLQMQQNLKHHLYYYQQFPELKELIDNIHIPELSKKLVFLEMKSLVFVVKYDKDVVYINVNNKKIYNELKSKLNDEVHYCNLDSLWKEICKSTSKAVFIDFMVDVCSSFRD